jgi:hypothetical protein
MKALIIAVLVLVFPMGCFALGTCDATTYQGIDAGAKINAAEADPKCSAVDATSFVDPVAAATVKVHKTLYLGSYTFRVDGSPGINLGNHSCLIGRGRQETIISTTSPTADVIYTNPGNNWACGEKFTIQSSVPRTAGAGLHLGAGHGSFRDILVYPVWDGIKLDRVSSSNVNYFENISMMGGGGGNAWHCGIFNGGVPSGTVSGNFFHNIVIAADPTPFADAMLCIADGSDGISISDSQFVKGHGDSVALHLERFAGGNPPEWIKCTNCYFEAGMTANGIVADSLLTFDCLNCYVGTCLNGIVLNGGTGFQWVGGQIVNNQQHGIHIKDAINTSFNNVRLGNNSLQANDSFDDIKIEPNVKNFTIIGNIFAPVVKSTKQPKWNIEIGGGSSTNYYVINNIIPGSAASGSIVDNGSKTARKSVQQ